MLAESLPYRSYVERFVRALPYGFRKTALPALIVIMSAAHLNATPFTAILSPNNYAVPRASSASGFATLEIVNTPTGLAIDYFIQIDGIDLDGLQTPGDSTDDLIQLHIHGGYPSESGPMRFGIVDPEHDQFDRVIDGAAGTITGRWDPEESVTFPGGSPQPPESFLLGFNEIEAGLWYLNVHTNRLPTGEIRGQFLSPVPEPGCGLMLAPFILFAVRRRKQRHRRKTA